MKSITTTMVLMILLTTFSLSAQTTVGINAGVSFANVVIKTQGVSASPKLKPGITGGLFADFQLVSNFGFQPALNFVQKGYLVKDETGKETVTLNYLEIPVNFVYNKKQFYAGAGPSFAYGISGNDKVHYSGMPEDNQKVHFGTSENDDLKPFDMGINFLLGYKFKEGLTISANYTLGLNRINNSNDDPLYPDENFKIKNRYFAVKIGYAFSGSKKK